MNDDLLQAWADAARDATQPEGATAARTDGSPVDAVLSALAYTLAVELTGDLAHAPPDVQAALRRAGQRALLTIGPARPDEGEAGEARHLAAELARDGLRALAGRPPNDPPPVTGVDLRATVPAADLVRLLRGRLDGLAAGSLAHRIRRSPAARAELTMLQELRAPERTLQLAAAGVDLGAALDPSSGRSLGVHAELGAEAIAFVGAAGSATQIAVYAETAAPVRLVASGLTPVLQHPGYWLGEIAPEVSQLEAVLHVGEQTAPWVLELT